jgi:hypothetical protein
VWNKEKMVEDRRMRIGTELKLRNLYEMRFTKGHLPTFTRQLGNHQHRSGSGGNATSRRVKLDLAVIMDK